MNENETSVILSSNRIGSEGVNRLMPGGKSSWWDATIMQYWRAEGKERVSSVALVTFSTEENCS